MTGAHHGSAAGLRIAWFGHAEGRRADGLSAYSRVLVQALEARGAEIIFFHHDSDGNLVPAKNAVPIPGWRGKTVTISGRHSMRRITAELRAFAPDIVHLSWSFSLLDAKIGELAQELKCPSVATFHLPHGDPGSFRAWIMRRLYRYHRGGLMYFDRCIALSQPQRDLLVRVGYPSDRIIVLQNAVDTERISPGTSELKTRLHAGFVFGFMGRLDPEKRPLQLLESFLALRLPEDSVLAFAGSGSLQKRLETAAAGAPSVRIMGLLRSDAERLEFLRGCDVFVLPSTAEGLALSLLEAMAAGCAIVATDAGDDGNALGEAGLVVPTYPLNPALGEAMQRLYQDAGLRSSLGNQARRRVVENFSMEKHVDAILELYRDLASRPRAA